MYYPTTPSTTIRPTQPRNTIRDRVETEVVPEIPTDSWRDHDELLPLQYTTDPWTIAALCLPFCTGEPRTDAVYVLECLPNHVYEQTAAVYLGSTQKPWNGRVEGANRVLYVGMTVDLLRRLDQHLNSPGADGAQFTTVFPPVRVLHVSWWSSFTQALEAEKITAECLRTRFPNDYIYQA